MADNMAVRSDLGDGVLDQLEEAARIVLAPAGDVSSDKRKSAELLFHELRAVPRPYSLCQCILDSGCSSYVKFQAIVTIKESLLREWVAISSEEKQTLLKYLFHHDLLNSKSSDNYLQKQMFVLISILLKRGVIEWNGENVLKSYIYNISQLLINSVQVELGCSFLSTLLAEFSSCEGSSSIGMPLDFHLKCKQCLEQSGGLLLVFTMATQTLMSYVNDYSSFNDRKILMLTSLNLEILSWDFCFSKVSGSKFMSNSMNSGTLKPPPSFREVLLNPTVVNIFMQLLCYFSNHSEFIVTVCQCLSQLASLSGPIFASKGDQIIYFIAFLESFIPSLMQGLQLSDNAVYGVSCIFRQLLTSFSRTYFTSLNDKIAQDVVKVLVNLFEISSQRSVALEMTQKDPSVLEESSCFLLETIYRLLDAPVDNMSLDIRDSLLSITNIYLQNKLNHPRGLRHYCTGDTIALDLTDDDRDSHFDELSYIGNISRHILKQFCPVLLNLLTQCYSRCIELITTVVSATVDVLELEALYEDIHWLLLITAFTLTDVVDGEESVIPDLLVLQSVDYQNTDSCSLKELVLNTNFSDTSRYFCIDPIVSLIVCMCQWCVIEREMVEKGLKNLVSPQVSESATWSLCTVCHTYLILSKKYEKIGGLLSDFIVCDSDNSRWLLSFLLDKILFNASVWFSEEKLTRCSMKMLSKLCQSNSTRSAYFCNTEKLWLFMKDCASGRHLSVTVCSPSVQKDIFLGLFSCACGDLKDRFVKELLGLLCSRFDELMISFDNDSSEDAKTFLFLLESWSGVITASHNSFVNVVFPVLFPVLSTCVRIMELGRGSQVLYEAILNLFCNVSEHFLLFLNDVNVKQFYQVMSELNSVFAKVYMSKYHTNIPDDIECDDLVVFIQTLSHLTTKDYIDFLSPTDANEANLYVDVVLRGLCTVLPVMNGDLLKYPEVCKKFYELLRYICEIFPDYLCTLPADLLQYTFTLIIQGCTRYGVDITLPCIECIESLSNSSPSANVDVYIQAMKLFLRELLNELLVFYCETDLTSHFIGAIYQLMCCLSDNAVNLEEVLLAGNANNQFMKEFIEASQPILTGSKVHRKEFKAYFVDILPKLRSNYCRVY